METFATIHDLLTAYETIYIPTLAPSTQPTHRCRLRNYFDALRPLPCESVTVPVLQQWFNTNRTRSETQAILSVRLLRSAINIAIEWGLWTWANPAQRVRVKTLKRRTRYVTEMERPSLLAEIEREPVKNRLYFYFPLFCGCRPGEAEKVKISEIQHGMWVKPSTKNGSEQRVPLPSQMVALLERHLASGWPGQVYVFENFRTGRPHTKTHWHREWEMVRQRAKLHDVHLHDLRRTCATSLTNGLDATGRGALDLNTVSRGVLNHSSLSTTQIYTIPSIERIRYALDRNMRGALPTEPNETAG